MPSVPQIGRQPGDSTQLACCERGITPLIGLILLLAITVALASVVAIGATSFTPESTAPTAALSLEVDAETNELQFMHTAGDSIDVRELSLRIAINGEHLEYEPPVPFVGATGFVDTPGGPFNAKTDPLWDVGERASFRVASTNDPSITAGDEVVVTLVVNERTVSRLEVTAD